MAHETAFSIPIASVSILRLIVELHRELIMLITNAVYRFLVIYDIIIRSILWISRKEQSVKSYKKLRWQFNTLFIVKSISHERSRFNRHQTHDISRRLTHNRSIRLFNRFAIVMADTIDRWRKLEVHPTNYKQPFSETFSDEIHHPLTRSDIM